MNKHDFETVFESEKLGNLPLYFILFHLTKASLVYLDYLGQTYEVSFSCAGTIISESFILTAAHCATGNRRPSAVRLGKVSINVPKLNFPQSFFRFFFLILWKIGNFE